MSADILPMRKRARSRFLKVPVSDRSPNGPFIPNLVLNAESGVYYVRKEKTGKRPLFASTGETTKGAARTIAERMIAEWIQGKHVRKYDPQRTVAEIADELETVLTEEFKNGDRRRMTHLSDKVYLKKIRSLFGEVPVADIDEVFWDDWVRTVGKRMNQTLFDTSKYLSKVLTFAYQRGYIGRKPTIKNPDKRPRGRTGRVYTNDEIADLVEAADTKTLAQIALGYECGLRSYEVRCLEKAWLTIRATNEVVLDLPPDFVKANARTILLSPKASSLIAHIVKSDLSGSRFVFPSASDPERAETSVYQNRRWRKIVKDAGVSGRAWFRYLRQTFYDRALLELGLSIQHVSQYGGTSIKTLQDRYLKQDPDKTKAIAGAVTLPSRDKSVTKGKRNA